jgi:hypothetical protein
MVMKKLVFACVAALGLSACGGDQAKCEEALAAFEEAKTTCMDDTSTADVWFAQSACDGANDDNYDNTEFYDCLIENFSGTDVNIVCETDGQGDPTAVRQFEDTSESSEPPGCRELYQNTPQ